MKIVRRDFVRSGPGSVKMFPDESDDLWIAYNLISEGDSVFATTVRKVLREAASWGRDAERVKLKLEIRLEYIGAYAFLCPLVCLWYALIILGLSSKKGRCAKR